MLHKTRGIVFRLVNYSETSIIVTIFTEAFGLQSYIVNGVRKKAKSTSLALYQPLTLLDLVVYHRENASIMRIKDVRCLYPYGHIAHDFKKSTIALFLCEVVNKCVKEEAHAHELCDFLIHSFIHLDQMETDSENFHLIFLIQLSRHLGFGPTLASEISEGWMADSEEEKIISLLLQVTYTHAIAISNRQRRNILDMILRFYTLHTENFGELKSLPVIREIIQ
ncbi:MAG: DNA repair protein RecO [Bacteroidetes bacterium]|nr:DNA repair protein RecO [Bacteroidota bacterium]MBS1540635.1 DNA repair protein RecO [Bacteroidota bacterium]